MSESSLAQIPSTNGHGPKRAILYARVSTKRQAEDGNSLEQQLGALHEFAEREGFEVVEEVRDAGYSGTTIERPGLWRVRELVAQGDIDAVLVQDRDRLSREPAYHWLLGEEFKKSGTVIRTLSGHGVGDDPDDPVAQLTSGMLDQVSKFERSFTALRMRRGKEQIAKQGKVLASSAAPRYGFMYNAARDGYEIDEERMAVVRRIFHWVAGGETLYGVVERLHAEGIPSPRNGAHGTSGRWTTAVIRAMIRNPVYEPHLYEEVCQLVAPEVAANLDPDKAYGLWYYAGIPVPVPSSEVPREIVEMARERIKHNRKASNAGKRFWPLSGGILCCALCGSSMEPSTTRPKDKTYHYYRCRNSYKGWPRCENRTLLRAEDIEETTWAFVRDLFRDPDRLRMEFDKMIERDKAALRGDPDAKVKRWARRFADLDVQKSRAQDLAIRGLLEPDELAAKLEELGRERAIVQRELASAQSTAEHIQELERFRDEAIAHFALLTIKRMGDLSPQDQHETYKYLDLRLEVNDEHEVRISGALYPDGSYFDPTGSVCGVETGSSTASAPIGDPCSSRGWLPFRSVL